MVYEVVVGNIGTVHHGNDRRTAERVFAEYVSQSKEGYGRASGEPVTLLGDGEILKEYAGERTGMDGRRGGLNDREREQWIQNDEGLYNWWKSTRQAVSKFIKENREELDRLIMAALNAPPSKGPYLMGASPGRFQRGIDADLAVAIAEAEQECMEILVVMDFEDDRVTLDPKPKDELYVEAAETVLREHGYEVVWYDDIHPSKGPYLMGASLSRFQVEEIKRIKELSSKTLDQARLSLKIVEDAASLSSGTLATLTGLRRYDDLDAVQADFTAFVRATAPRREWMTWMDAWKEFDSRYRSDRPSARMGAKGRYRQMWSLDVFYPGKGWESRVISYDRESLLQDAKFHEEEFGTKVRVVPVENVR